MNREGLSPVGKLWLFLTILGTGVNLWLLMVVGREWQQNRQLAAQIQELLVKIEDRSWLADEQQLLEPRFQELENFFLDGETGVAQLAAALEEIAKKTGVEVSLAFEDFPKKIDIGGVYQQGLRMQVEVLGSYQAVINWLKAVEQLPYFIRLDEVKLGLPRQGAGIKAEFSGVIFLKN